MISQHLSELSLASEKTRILTVRVGSAPASIALRSATSTCDHRAVHHMRRAGRPPSTCRFLSTKRLQPARLRNASSSMTAQPSYRARTPGARQCGNARVPHDVRGALGIGHSPPAHFGPAPLSAFWSAHGHLRSTQVVVRSTRKARCRLTPRCSGRHPGGLASALAPAVQHQWLRPTAQAGVAAELISR